MPSIYAIELLLSTGTPVLRRCPLCGSSPTGDPEFGPIPPKSTPSDNQQDAADGHERTQRDQKMVASGDVNRFAIGTPNRLAPFLSGQELTLNLRLTRSIFGGGKGQGDQCARQEKIAPEPN